MKIGEPYYRKKKNKIVIEQKINGKTKYHKTLPEAKTMINILASYNNKDTASFSTKQQDIKQSQKGAQVLLGEPSEEGIRKTLEEAGIHD